MIYRQVAEFLPWRARGPRGKCRGERHVLDMPGLRLQSPTARDYDGARVGACDPEAQRWLEWTDQLLAALGKREHLLGVRPGTGRTLPAWVDPDVINLVAIDPAADRIAGMVGVNWQTHELGGWLVPEYRGRGLGAVLFAGAAQLGHGHLGFKTVFAGAHPDNAASIGALTAAGFVPTAGAPTHVQPNGRVIPSRWFRHEGGRLGRCDARG